MITQIASSTTRHSIFPVFITAPYGVNVTPRQSMRRPGLRFRDVSQLIFSVIRGSQADSLKKIGIKGGFRIETDSKGDLQDRHAGLIYQQSPSLVQSVLIDIVTEIGAKILVQYFGKLMV